MEFRHTPVMVQEVLDHLEVSAGGCYIDGTVGLGGHASAILQAAAGVKLIGLDRDRTAIDMARDRLQHFGERVRLVQGSFSRMLPSAHEAGWQEVDGILLDLGISSMQIDDPVRGFSLRLDGPLDMRMDTRSRITAAILLNERTEGDLKAIFRDFGEERHARRIARAVVERRQRVRWSRTSELVELIDSVVGRRRESLPAATRCFMALRIAVNRELDELRDGLSSAVELLRTGGRIVVISFHSLEDRIVKHFFRTEAAECVCPPGLPVCCCGKTATLSVLTRRPQRPSQAEVELNRRAASAKLRAAERQSTEDRKSEG